MTFESDDSILTKLNGQQLSAVSFVMDYIQLHFESAILTAYVWPQVKDKAALLSAGNSHYKDALCDCIGAIVAECFEDEERLSIEFENGVVIEISLREADQVGPEAAMFSDKNSDEWEVW